MCSYVDLKTTAPNREPSQCKQVYCLLSLDGVTVARTTAKAEGRAQEGAYNWDAEFRFECVLWGRTSYMYLGKLPLCSLPSFHGFSSVPLYPVSGHILPVTPVINWRLASFL